MMIPTLNWTPLEDCEFNGRRQIYDALLSSERMYKARLTYMWNYPCGTSPGSVNLFLEDTITLIQGQPLFKAGLQIPRLI